MIYQMFIQLGHVPFPSVVVMQSAKHSKKSEFSIFFLFASLHWLDFGDLTFLGEEIMILVESAKLGGFITFNLFY